jgi:hypothetical protein
VQFRSKDDPSKIVDAVLWDGATFNDRPVWLTDAIERGVIELPGGSGNIVTLNQPDVGILHTDNLYPQSMLWHVVGSDGEFFMPMGKGTWGLLYEEV